jgi:transglutaminase/protease-like cytokinesis protein 3
MLREGLAYQYLSTPEKNFYRIALGAFSARMSSFDCTQVDRSIDIMKVIQSVLGDNPSIVYFDKSKLEIEESFLGKKIKLTGVYAKAQIDKMNLSMDVSANLVVSSLKARSSDEFSLLINLSEHLQKNVRYDKDELQSSSRGIVSFPLSHNAYGAIMNGKAVCDGFSSAFTFLAQKLGFQCMTVIGRSAYATTLIDHAWNIIKIRNNFYHMDTSWDTRKFEEFGEFSYAYFALSDRDIERDHEWIRNSTPACTDNMSTYYHKSGLFASNMDQLKSIVCAFAKNRNHSIRLKLSSNIILPNNAGEFLVQMVLAEIAQAGRRTQANYSWNDKTRCFFAKIIA